MAELPSCAARENIFTNRLYFYFATEPPPIILIIFRLHFFEMFHNGDADSAFALDCMESKGVLISFYNIYSPQTYSFTLSISYPGSTLVLSKVMTAF